MLPVFWAFMRSYAPVIMLPIAAVVGVIGYNIENILSDKYTPFKPSIGEQREERHLKEMRNNECGDAESVQTLTEKKFVPKSIFERNQSPQLQKQKQ